MHPRYASALRVSDGLPDPKRASTTVVQVTNERYLDGASNPASRRDQMVAVHHANIRKTEVDADTDATADVYRVESEYFCSTGREAVVHTRDPDHSRFAQHVPEPASGTRHAFLSSHLRPFTIRTDGRDHRGHLRDLGVRDGIVMIC
jgi:hypothetical protein